MPDDDAMRRVIQTFAGGEARLVVTDEAGGRRSVEVSHEALIRHWDKLRAWIDENRDKLRTREFLKANRAEWLKHGRDPGLLDLPSLYVEAARSLHEQPGDVVIDDVKDYIEALLRPRPAAEGSARKRSRREELEAARRLADERARSEEKERGLREQAEGSAKRARQRLWFALAASVLLLFVAGYAFREARVANEQRAIAEAQTATATNRRLSRAEGGGLNNETHALAALSRAAARRDGRSRRRACAGGLASRRARQRRLKGRCWRDAVRCLSLAFSDHPPVVVMNHGGPVNGALYSPDGERILSWSEDKTLRLWDAATGAAIGAPLRHEDPVYGAALFAGRRSASCHGLRTRRAGFGTRRRARRSARRCGMRPGPGAPLFSPDGARVCHGLGRQDAAGFGTRRRARRSAGLSGMTARSTGAAFSPDGERILSRPLRQDAAGFGTRRRARRSRSSAAMTARSRRAPSRRTARASVAVEDKTAAGFGTRRRERRSASRCGMTARSGAPPFRRTARASSRSSRQDGAGFGTRRPARRSARLCGHDDSVGRAPFAGRRARLSRPEDRTPRGLGRGDGRGDRRSSAAMTARSGARLFAGRRAHPVVV